MLNFVLGLVAGILVGVFLYSGWLCASFARGRVPKAWEGIIAITPEFKQKIKKAINKGDKGKG